MLDLLLALHNDPEQKTENDRLGSESGDSEHDDEEEHQHMTQVSSPGDCSLFV